jgi:hypothetical protein
MIAYPMASWFETRAAKFTQAAYTCLHAALLTMRVDEDPHPEERLLSRVSKDEAAEPETAPKPRRWESCSS